MLLRFLGLSAAFTACCAFSPISGYTPVSDVGYLALHGQAIEAVGAAISNEPRNWTAAVEEYERVPATNVPSLRNVLPSPESTRPLLATFSAHYGSEDYMHDFVSLALSGEGEFALDGKLREELTMKGIVLQGVLMASMSYLHDSIAFCLDGKTNVSDGAPHYVDYAWALYACSEGQGPIRLAEKRAPQFAAEATHPTEAGSSQVNVRLLALFQALQISAMQGNCSDMKAKVPKIIAQMQVPVIQGMLREAYEADANQADEHKGADGFVEVAEGWAFTRAVLPEIAACSSEAASIIERNMNTLGLGPAGPHVPEGYAAVKNAVESTYGCLGISCLDVNAMISPWKTDALLWEPCADSDLNRATESPQSDISGAQSVTVSSWMILGGSSSISLNLF